MVLFNKNGFYMVESKKNIQKKIVATSKKNATKTTNKKTEINLVIYFIPPYY